MSDEHFTVDGTLIQAWASQKSFRRKDGLDDDGANFHGQKRKNQTHESTTDPDARLYKKSYGKESQLAYLGHALVENRNGLIPAAMATQADGYAEREAALLLLEAKQKGGSQRITVGADKAYDTKDFVTAARVLNVTAHVTRNEKGRHSNMDRRTTRHPGYGTSLSRRWLVEKSFGWLKQTGPVQQVKLRGLHKVDWIFSFSCAAHNLMRLPGLIALQAVYGLRKQPNALLSANGPQLIAPRFWHTSGTLRLARWADGRDTSVVTTVRSAGSASAYAIRKGSRPIFSTSSSLKSAAYLTHNNPDRNRLRREGKGFELD